MSKVSVQDIIDHYQKSISKYTHDEKRVVYCLKKLKTLPITVAHLKETGVGRTVNALNSFKGEVGIVANELLNNWKQLVKSDEEDEASSPGVNEEKRCPQTPSIHSSVRNGNVKCDQDKSYPSSHSKSSMIKEEDDFRSKSKDTLSEKRKSNDHNEESNKKGELSLNEYAFNSETKECSEKKYKKDGLRESSNSHNKSKHSGLESVKVSSRNESSKSSDDKKCDKNRKDKTRHEGNHSKSKSSSSKKDEFNRSQSKSSSPEVEMDKKEKSRPESSKHSSYGKSKSSTSEDKKDKPKTESSHSKSKSSHDKSKSETRKHSSSDDDKDKKKDEQNKLSRSSSSSKSKSSSLHTKEKQHSSACKSKTESSKMSNEKPAEVRDRGQKRSAPDGEVVKEDAKKPKYATLFDEYLNSMPIYNSNKKRSSGKTAVKTVKAETSTSKTANNSESVMAKYQLPARESPPLLLSPNLKLEPLTVNIAATLPEISPNYKPLPKVNMNSMQKMEEDRMLHEAMTNKNQRTKVYSGNKKSGYTTVPSLFEICIRMLIEHIDCITETGGIPYDILKPVLETATPDQLFNLEYYNPYLLEDTDELWQLHCGRKFKANRPQETETWREMFLRCTEERETRLKDLTNDIKKKIQNAAPVRTTKLAYVDNIVKPPRNVMRNQAKHGTREVAATSSDTKKKLLVNSATSSTNITVPTPVRPRPTSSNTSSVRKVKAPLMAKALQLIKGRYRR